MTRDRAAYERYIAWALDQPNDKAGLANRCFYARIARKAADTPGRAWFAREQYRAASRAFSRLVAAERPKSKDLWIMLFTAIPGGILGALLGSWLWSLS